MSRLTNHAVRAGVSAVGVAAGLMFLASTSQTPDGFTQASFDGPLSIFGNSAPEHQGDVLAIGDGTGDTSELAAILNGPTPVGNPEAAYQKAFQTGAESPSAEVSAVPTAGPAVGASTSKQSLSLPKKSVVDAQGRVDCTGSVSCVTDSATNVTTVTYPDGVVALVQKINDMTVVAYKTLADALPSEVQALLPAAPPSHATQQAATQVPAATIPTNQTPAAADPTAEAKPSVAPVPSEISASSVRPRVTVESTQQALAPGQSRNANQTGGITIPPVKPTSPFDVVKGVINSVVGAVTGHNSSHTKKPTVNTPSPEPASNPETGQVQDSAVDSGQ